MNPKRIGLFTLNAGQKYDCYFHEESKRAWAVGPLPDPNINNGVASVGEACSVFAETEEVAKKRISEILGEGNF